MDLQFERPIRLGMVGGGKDAFIGGVHQIASRLDGQFELVAGVLSSTAEKAQESGRAIGLSPDRIYDDFVQMAQREAMLDNGIEAVAIVAPNHVHYAASKIFLQHGIHVICDKPLSSTLADAEKLVAAVECSQAQFFLTHNYTGYPLIRQAREMVVNGKLGDIRIVQVEYSQDWLTLNVDNKQANWRTDPARSGLGGCVSDIGTHAFNLVEFVCEQTVESLAADLQSFVKGRELDDNAHVLLRFESGARGMLWSSQVAPGNENNLKLRVYGEKGGLAWAQENPNVLSWTELGRPEQLLTRGGAGTFDSMENTTRLPPGHPEGYLEGFANIYREIAAAIRHHKKGEAMSNLLPNVHDGLRGIKFIEACVHSSERDTVWITL